MYIYIENSWKKHYKIQFNINVYFLLLKFQIIVTKNKVKEIINEETLFESKSVSGKDVNV